MITSNARIGNIKKGDFINWKKISVFYIDLTLLNPKLKENKKTNIQKNERI